MLQLFAVPPSLYCAKVRIVLRAKGLAWEEVPPTGGYGSSAYRAVVPSGNLPALRDDDLLICDSEAIAEYLDETRPEPPMLSADPRERARQRDRGRFHDTRLEPAVRMIFPYLHGPEAPDSVLAAWSAGVRARLDQFGALLALAPEADGMLSLGDCGYPITFAWLSEIAPRFGLELPLAVPVRRYRERIGTHPAVAAELADYLPKLAAYLGDR